MRILIISRSLGFRSSGGVRLHLIRSLRNIFITRVKAILPLLGFLGSLPFSGTMGVRRSMLQGHSKQMILPWNTWANTRGHLQVQGKILESSDSCNKERVRWRYKELHFNSFRLATGSSASCRFGFLYMSLPSLLPRIFQKRTRSASEPINLARLQIKTALCT